MAPSRRDRNSNRRQNRAVELNEYEGIPVRHWRRDYVTVAPPPAQENNAGQNDVWAIELPHGMPKDSHLLPQHSQDLLRAARSGKIYKRPAPVEEEEGLDAEIGLEEKAEKKEDDPQDEGFMARAWKQIPRHMEEQRPPEYLAKRRKGLVTAGARPAPVAPTLTQATVKRLDAAGNEYVQDVIVPNGQVVEGEIIATTVIPDPNAVAVDPYAIQPTPPKRKGPVPRKKKMKGPGRGRKKNLLPPTSVPSAEGAAPADGAAPAPAGGPDGIELDSGAAETTDAPTHNESEDVEMGEGSAANSSDEEGEEGDDNEDDEYSTDAQNSPSKPPSLPSLPLPVPAVDLNSPDVIMSDTEFSRAPPNILTDAQKMDTKSGSPLKNLALTTSTLASPVVESEPSTNPVPEIQSPLVVVPTASDLDEVMQQETLQSAPETLPLPPPAPNQSDVQAAVEERLEEEEEEEMLLDIVDKASNAQIGAEPPSAPVPAHAELPVPVEPAETEKTIDSAPEAISEISALQPKKETDAPLEATPDKLADAEIEAVPAESEGQAEDADDDDGFPDLLGGLEKSLGSKKEAAVSAAPVEEIPGKKAEDDVEKVEEALAAEDA